MLEVYSIKGNRVRSSERDPVIAFERVGNYFAACALDDQGVKLSVHFAVAVFVGFDQVPLGEDFVAFAQAIMK